MKSCFLYPGQGAQYAGMARDLWEGSAAVQDLFGIASSATGIDAEELIFKADEETLKQTRNTQLAVTLNNVASALLLKEAGIESEGCAGFSLGEYAALWDAGVLDLPSLFRVIDKRGAFLEEAGRALISDAGAPGMAAVLGLSLEEVSEVLKKHFRGKDLYAANHNSPIQVVLSGTAECLREAESLMTEAGALRYVRLKVSGPFHSPLLSEAGKKFGAFLQDIPFGKIRKTLYSNVTGKAVSEQDDLKDLCVRQISGSVLWCNVEQAVLEDGYDSVFETGPGMVLSGLWKNFHKGFRVKPAGKWEQIKKITSEAV